MFWGMAEVLIATSNPHKVDEIGAVLALAGVRAIGLSEAPGADGIAEPVEDADTFAGNARIKAAAYARATGRLCLADDSGLEVDALGGAPGVYSARYAGVGETRAERDRANIEKLLCELAEVADEDRTARFVCAMCLAAADGSVVAMSRGEFAGSIGREARGENGFGYDPLLVLEDGRTSAELSADEKNSRSHRGAAVRGIVTEVVKAMRREDGA